MGTGHELLRHNRKQRHLAAGGVEVYERHFDHQVIFIAWILAKISTTGGGLCGDGVGIGKSHEIILAIQAGTHYQMKYRGDENFGPTVLVTPSTLKSGWVATLQNHIVLSVTEP